MNPVLLVSQLLILLFSVIVHEVMHGYVALRFGDRTAQNAGRLTLNPIPHIDPIGTVLLPILSLLTGARLFGWAKPVPVNPLNFSDIRKGELFVSAAGIVSNFALALIAAVLFHILNLFSFPSFLLSALVYAVQINLVLGIFNLVPVPPLDGSKIVMSQLSYKAAQEYAKLESYGFILIIILLYLNVFSLIFALTIPPLLSLLQIPGF